MVWRDHRSALFYPQPKGRGDRQTERTSSEAGHPPDRLDTATGVNLLRDGPVGPSATPDPNRLILPAGALLALRTYERLHSSR